MLKNIYIENIAVAKCLNVDFKEGFTVITGETGSGKSVMVDCLNLIAGAKSTRDIIRNNESKATVCAIFSDLSDKSAQLSELGFPPDENDELMITRTIASDGKTSIKANRRTVTLSQLKEAGYILLGIDSQNEKSFLYHRNEYTAFLDGYAGNEHLLEEYRQSYENLKKIRDELQSLREALKEKNMMTDILSYQIKEIDSAKLSTDDEEEKLRLMSHKIKGIEKNLKYQKIIYKALYQNDNGMSVSYLLERAISALSQISDIVENADDMIKRLEEYRYDIIDIADSVRDAIEVDDVENPNEMLTQIESRLSLIERLKRKYGSSIAEIKKFRNDAVSKLHKIEESETALDKLERELGKITNKTKEFADKLRATRIKAASKLSDEIMGTLKYLDMPKVKFYIEIEPETNEFGYKFTRDGADKIDYKISVNPGEAPMSLSKVASGGEMSRIMLALRVSLNKKSGADTVIFDEIDSGVSGSTSERIGLVLKKLSERVQVICVTHSPQIAAVAESHYLIMKNVVDNRAESSIQELDYDGRVNEISRIIGGIDVTEKQRAAAREMISKNN